MASPSSSQPQQPRRHSSSFRQRVERKVANVRERSRGTMDLPERFKVDDDEDADDGTGVGDGKNINFAHQSMYGMIAAAQSRNTFAGWFQHDSGGESDEDDKDGTSKSIGYGKALGHKQSGSSRNTLAEKLGVKGHGSKLSENKLARSFLKPIKEKGDSQLGDPMTQSQLLPPLNQRPQEVEQARSARADAPILEGKLQAMAKAEMESASSSGESKVKGEEVVKYKAAKSLPEIIANMFQFDEPEDVISEYPCWYTQNVLLKGLMYITGKHVCFYSYLHKKTNQVLKQGHIGKRSKHGYLYHRYWFVLKGDVFSYYASSSDPYFPLGVVDLRYAISADVTTPEAGKEATDFTITTPDRVYYYRADHPQSAKEWVQQLQRVIFRGHNDGDAVKISLPLTNILDVEETNALDFAETIELRALARDDTFAVDEYFFTFFGHGKNAINLLQSLIEDNKAKHATIENDTLDRLQRGQASSGDGSRSSSKGVREPIRSTLSPLSAARAASLRSSSERSRSSAEVGKANDQRTFDSKNRSGISSDQTPRSKSPQSPILQDSTESFLTSSSTLDNEINPDMSASQMLVGDGVFQRPTLRMPHPRPTAPGRVVEHLEDSQTSSRDSSLERVRVQPPTRQGTEQPLDSGQPKLRRKGSGGSGRTIGAEDKKQAQPVDIKGPGRLVRGISMPLQHAMTVADMMRTSSKRVGSYLSSSPKYLSNFSEALVGGKRHYTDAAGLTPNDSVGDIGQEVDVVQDELRFRAHFGLPSTEKLLSAFFCWMQQTIPTYGKIYIGNNYFCFRSLIYGMRKKFVMPYKKITSAQKLRGSLLRYPGMVLIIEGAADVFFDFASDDLSKEAVSAVHQRLTNPWEREAASTILTTEESQDAVAAATENDLLQEARKDGHADLDQQLQLPDDLQFAEHDTAPIVLDDSDKSIVDIKPKKSLRIVCLTIGSRGDVQPFIALCKRLRADGHRPKIATHIEFKSWVEEHGIDFAEVAGDPAELMRICVDNGMFTPSFLLTVRKTMKSWMDSLCRTGWAACKDAELLIESPVAMVGIHIAEALQIPYFRAFGMPFTRTRAYPQAFAQKESKTSGSYNYISYTVIDKLFWMLQAWQVNDFRRDALGLRPTSLNRMESDKVPFLYNVSPNVFIPPVDFSEWIKVTGYWFLDEGTDYRPPADLVRFIKQARDDEQKLVYVGFGSVVVADSAKMTKEIVNAIVKARVRCILSKGWSDRLKKEDPDALPANLPDCIFPIRSAPHDWLFKQVDAAVHHGGAGTTGASLRAGIPTLIRPFFGDQYFWASRVQDLGVGAHLNTLAYNELSKNVWLATHDDRMRKKAAYLGKQIRAENGVETAVHALYSQMEYAEGLIKAKVKKEEEEGVEAEDVQDNWTLIDGDSLEVAPVPVEEMAGKEDESGDDDDTPAAHVAVKEGKKKMRAGT